jgi:hypothetical protein
MRGKKELSAQKLFMSWILQGSNLKVPPTSTHIYSFPFSVAMSLGKEIMVI